LIIKELSRPNWHSWIRTRTHRRRTQLADRARAIDDDIMTDGAASSLDCVRSIRIIDLSSNLQRDLTISI
jgi:hypothetical protein